MTGRVLLLAAALAVPALLSSAGGAGDGKPRPANLHAVTADSVAPVAARTPASASATWCGTATSQDVEPNVVAGHPVHWLYAVPSDAPDRFSTFSHVMQTDAEAIDAWWRREDPARTLRNDLRQLSCGAQLDASSLRLPLQGAVLDDEFGFGDIFESLDDAGFDSGFAKYIVYYDGPVQEPDLCGLGGSFGSVGLAVVYVRACLGASTAAIAAHELLHTLGAVPDAAPNNCPPPHDGHTCVGGNPDTPNSDLMWWRLGNQTLEQKLLDPGRDDYYGHSVAVHRHAGRVVARPARPAGAASPERHRAGHGHGGRPRPSLHPDLHDDVELGHAPASERPRERLGETPPLERGVQRRRHVRMRRLRHAGQDGRRRLRAAPVPADRGREGTGHGPRVAGRDRVPPALLGVGHLARPGPPHGEAPQGLDAPLLDRRLQGEEAHLHGSDEQGDERPSRLRQNLRTPVRNARLDGGLRLSIR